MFGWKQASRTNAANLELHANVQHFMDNVID